MELNREPDPQPAPPIATGAVIEKKKMQVITAAAILFGLIVAMFLGWLVMRHKQPVVAQGATPVSKPAGVPAKQPPALSEAAEEAYERGKREGARSSSAFHVGDGSGASSGDPAKAETVAATLKRTPSDDYEDLLQKAALADSTVPGERHERSSAVPRDSDLGSSPRPASPVLGHDGGRLDTSGANRADGAHQQGLVELPKNSILAGTYIKGALVGELDGENVGPVKVQTSTDVYYPLTFEIAIPQGSIFLGEAQRVSSQFQHRLAVTFDRLQLIRENKVYEIKLDKIPGLDQRGAAALKGKVDNHYLETFGASLAIGAIGGLAQIGQGSYGGYGGYDAETQIRNGISQTMAQNASQILNRFLNRMPTVVIRPGTPVVVYIPFGIEMQ